MRRNAKKEKKEAERLSKIEADRTADHAERPRLVNMEDLLAERDANRQRFRAIRALIQESNSKHSNK